MRAPVPSRPCRTAPWAGFAVAAAGAGLYLLTLTTGLGGGLLRAWLPPLLYLSAAALCLLRISKSTGDRVAWTLLGAGMSTYGLSSLALVVAGHSGPLAIPWFGHAGWLLFYVLAYASVVVLLHSRQGALASSLALDGLIVAVTLASVLAVFLVPALVGTHGIAHSDAAAGIAYPIADLLLIGVALCACCLAGWKGVRSWALVIAGALLLLVADVAIDVEAAAGTHGALAQTRVLFPLGLLLFAAAAWQPPVPPHKVRADGFAVFAAPVACFTAALTVLVIGELGRIADVAEVLALGVLLLCAVRAALAHRDIRRLQEARRFERGFEDAEIGMVLVGPDRRWMRVNDALCRMLGRSAAELTGRTVDELVHPDDPGHAEMARRRLDLPDGPRSATYEMVLRRRDGRPVEIVVTAARIDGGAWIFGQAQDITERNRALRHSAALAELGRLAIETADPQSLMEQSLRLVTRALPSAHCVIASQEGDELTIAASARPEVPPRHKIGAGTLSQAGYTLCQQQAVIADDLYTEQRFTVPDLVHQLGAHSGLSVPLRQRGGARHVVLAHRTEVEGPFDELDVRFLQGVADVLAGALDRAEAEAETRRQALHDPLTGLANRAALAGELAKALRVGRGPGETVALMLLDVDRFKVVNDTLGHGAGDELLRLVAARLRRVTRHEDVVARLGGDEFVVVCPQLPRADVAGSLAQRIVDIFEEPFELHDRELFLTTSVGVALAVDGGSDLCAEELLRDADVAMYRAKDEGGGRFELFDAELRARVVRRLSLEQALRRALERDELVVHYQPVVDLSSGAITGFEALVRWEHPEQGLVPPGDFIPVAEDTGLIRPIGAWVLEAACRELAAFDAEHDGPPLRMSVNLSARQLTPELPELVRDVLARTGVDPSQLILEITESLLVEREPQLALLTELRDAGVAIALDDFGTGYSSLASVTGYALDYVKLDRSLIADLGSSRRAAGLVRAVVDMSAALDLVVVAEGLEEPIQAAAARDLGCAYGQGWLYSRALPAAEARAFLRAHECPREGTLRVA